MIIQLRGTNGSGKSTIVRKVMDRFNMVESRHIEGRRQPIGYWCSHWAAPQLWVVGHYETECGGCDTIASLDSVYEQISLAAERGYNVLYEGIMASGEYRRCCDLHRHGHNVLALGLDVPIEVCVHAIEERRARRGMTKPLDKKRTVRRLREVRSMMEHLKTCGVPTQWVNREQALDICLRKLGVIV